MNRTGAPALALAEALGPGVRVFADPPSALAGATLIINATTQGLGGGAGPDVDFDLTPDGAVVMDMVYKPLHTAFLTTAAVRGLCTVDGLEMLIGQAGPSFAAFYGVPPPSLDVRTPALHALGEGA